MNRRERIVFWAGAGAVFAATALAGSVSFVWWGTLGAAGAAVMTAVAVRDLRRGRRRLGNAYLVEQIGLVLLIAAVAISAAWARSMTVYAAGLLAVVFIAIVFKRLRGHP